MYKTIVCAIEATKEGKEVLSKASQLSKLCNGKLIVIHVVPYTLLPKNYQKALKEEFSPKIEKFQHFLEFQKRIK